MDRMKRPGLPWWAWVPAALLFFAWMPAGMAYMERVSRRHDPQWWAEWDAARDLIGVYRERRHVD